MHKVVNIKNSPEIEMMRISGRLLAQVLQLIEQEVRPGISTYELNAIAEEFIKSTMQRLRLKAMEVFRRRCAHLSMRNFFTEFPQKENFKRGRHYFH